MIISIFLWEIIVKYRHNIILSVCLATLPFLCAGNESRTLACTVEVHPQQNDGAAIKPPVRAIAIF